VKANNCNDSIERRQLDFIQRVGCIGYWEYDPAKRSMCLPDSSLALLASIAGGPLDAPRSFMDALSAIERQRVQVVFDQAIAKHLPFNIQLDLVTGDGEHVYVVVRGSPVDDEQGPLRLAGTFQDITNEKQREANHERVITQLQALLDALSQGVSVIDKDLRLILWNQRFHEILGFPQSMVFKNANFEDFIRLNAVRGEYGPGDPEEQVQAIVARARQFLPHRFERQLTGGRTVQVEGFPFKSGGEIAGFVTTYTDITGQKQSEEQLMRQRDVMKTIIDNFPGGISLCDADLKFTAYNDLFKELLGFPPSLFAKGWVDFEELARFNANRGEYGPGNVEEQVQTVVTRARNFEAHHIERARPNGRWLEIRGAPIASGGFVTSYIDITERKQMEDQVRQLAFFDPLTKLPNRRLLNDRLSQAMAASTRSACYGAVMVLDLDNFKPLNDTHGHPVGDLLLIEVARRLTSCVRESDTVARFGGDEFVLLLSDLDENKAISTLQAGIIAEKIRTSLSAPYWLNIGSDGKVDATVEHRCTASIGAALFIKHEVTQDDIFKFADAAMYQAKEAGRNSVLFCDPNSQ
jgi:diguanylate cyclase (GGDEF)-like protein